MWRHIRDVRGSVITDAIRVRVRVRVRYTRDVRGSVIPDGVVVTICYNFIGR